MSRLAGCLLLLTLAGCVSARADRQTVDNAIALIKAHDGTLCLVSRGSIGVAYGVDWQRGTDWIGTLGHGSYEECARIWGLRPAATGLQAPVEVAPLRMQMVPVGPPVERLK